MSLTEQQLSAVTAPGSVAVTAGAGTGKTHMLTERYLHHLQEHGMRPLQIVAATFTEAAATELRGRVRSRLRTAPALAGLAAELEVAQIGTLHALAARICREHPDAAGVPWDFSVQDELEGRLWLARHFRRAVADLSEPLDPSVSYRTFEQTLLALLADPFTARAALAADPASWPALIEEERERAFARIAGSERWLAAVEVLQSHRGPPDDRLEQQRSAALAAIESLESGDFDPGACAVLDTLTRRPGSAKAWGEALTEVREACGSIRDLYRTGSYAFELSLGPADEALRRALPSIRSAYRFVSEYLTAAKREARILDFSDLELHALRALDDAAVRDFYRRRWRAFLVDEFQDTNPVQAQLLSRLTGIAAVSGETVTTAATNVVELALAPAAKTEVQGTAPAVATVPPAGGRVGSGMVGSAGVEASPPRSGSAPAEGEAARGDHPPAILTVVGDEKQSIYGFRRADIEVFRAVRRAVAADGGGVVELSTSFRTHDQLMSRLNTVVQPALSALHQPLAGARERGPGEGPFLSVHLITEGPRLKQFRQRAEAHLLGELVARLLGGDERVFDKGSGGERPLRPGDIAILARTWDTLGPYGDELSARGIPIVHAGGGSLLEQREAKDALSLLRFLADPSDDLSLAAVLRSPFFAVADPALQLLAADARKERAGWWETLGSYVEAAEGAGALAVAADVLARLLARRYEEAPSRLLALADEFTGYTAVIANLPGGTRRLADWRGVIDLVTRLEGGHEDVFAVVRELRSLVSLEGAKIPRPGIEAGDAVALMSVHNAKGLEWPVVILPDITSGSSGKGSAVVFEAGAGVAFKVRDDEGEEVQPALFTILDERRKQREADEGVRVLYVALTRARDRLLLTGSKEGGGHLQSLAIGLENAAVPFELVDYDPEAAVPKVPLAQPSASYARTLLGGSGLGLSELPVTSLSTYALCPRRFHFEQILRHPGTAALQLDEAGANEFHYGESIGSGAAGEATDSAARIGTLAHLALERNIRDARTLARLDENLEPSLVERALAYADTFRTSPQFAVLRGLIRESERAVVLPLEITGAGEIVLRGVADAVGDDFVLDYKTGRRAGGDSYRLQVAVYAKALGRQSAHIAYLRDGELESLTAADLEQAYGKVRETVQAIFREEFTASPSPGKCVACPYSSICDDSA